MIYSYLYVPWNWPNLAEDLIDIEKAATSFLAAKTGNNANNTATRRATGSLRLSFRIPRFSGGRRSLPEKYTWQSQSNNNTSLQNDEQSKRQLFNFEPYYDAYVLSATWST